ncbi:MAG: TIM barrel protein [candidate division WOR-3 bacterium]
MNNLIGYQALFDFDSIPSCIKFARQHGFAFVELHLNNINFFRALEDSSPPKNFDILIHAADGFNLFTPSANLRQAAVNYLKYQINLACRIKARCLTFHIATDVPFAIEGVKHYGHEFFPEEYRKWVYDGLAAVSRFAGRKINLCVENTAGYRHPMVREIVDQLLGKGLFLTWDFGHTNCLDPKRRQEELAFFAKHRAEIKNCHLHDNDHHIDQHLRIGAGTVDFCHFLKILGSSRPYLTIETRPRKNVISSLSYLKKILQC